VGSPTTGLVSARSPNTGAAGLLRLGEGVRDTLREVAMPFLAQLNDHTEETVHLAVLRGVDVQFLESIESPRQLRVGSRVGRALPAYATSVGKAMLAKLPGDELHRLLDDVAWESVGPATLAGPDALARDLASVRRRGYAVSQESEAGVGSVGVAVSCPRPRGSLTRLSDHGSRMKRRQHGTACPQRAPPHPQPRGGTMLTPRTSLD
jgi:DNA-binding IclR family transcriptional regulator